MKKKIPSEKQIAAKHGVSVDYIIRQAEIGSTIEREHVTTHEEAYGIALQHISEFPNYYKKLLKMEKQLKSQWKDGKKSVKEEKEEVRYCYLCEKNETKPECSYGPSAWEMYTRKLNIEEDHKEIASGKKLDDEGYMAKLELDQMERSIAMLRKVIRKSNQQLPAWVQSKITRAADFVDTAAEYIASDEKISEQKCFSQFMREASFEIGPGHKSAQKQAKIRNLADRTSSTGEQVAAKSKLKGPEWKKPKLGEDWQKKNRNDGVDGMSGDAVKAYRRENQGSKLKTAVTTPPSQLKPGSADWNRRKNFCSRSQSWTGERGRAARRRWNCN